MFNWRELPFVRLLVPLIAGILLSYFFRFNNGWLIGLLAVWPLLLWGIGKVRGLFRYRWLFGALVYLAIFQLGYQAGHFNDERNGPGYFGRRVSPDETLLVAVVKDAPAHKEKWVRLTVAVKQVGQSADSLKPASGNALLYVARDSASEAIAYGDLLFFCGRITEVNPPGNPHSFDYRRYLHFQNIHHQAFLRAGDWEVLDSGMGNPVMAKAIVWQERFVATLRKHLTTPNEFTVGSALILGYRSELPEEMSSAYTDTGAMHVLAVSGMHVGILFVILSFLLKWIRLPWAWWKVTQVLLVLAGIWAFALVTGASPSVMRAAVMFSFLNIGLAMKRHTSIYNTLAASAFCQLIWQPFLLASVSFQLSYLALLGIVYFQPKIANLWYIRNRAGSYCWQLISVSLAAQLMVLPLSLLYFHQFPTYFWLSSLLLVPLSGVELGAGLLLFLLDEIWPWAATWVGKALWAMLKLGNEFVMLVQKLPLAVFDGIWTGALVAGLLYLAITSSMLAVTSKKFRWVLYTLVFLVMVGIHFAFTEWKQTGSRQLVIYDVYQHTVIDVFDGKNTVSIASPGIDEKTLSFAAEGHRFAMGMGKLQTVPVQGGPPFASGNVFFENGLLKFYEAEMAVVAAPIHFEAAEKIMLDYVLLSGSPKVRIEEISGVFAFKIIIFDHSNKTWQVEKWKAACAEMGIAFHDIAEEGAFVLDLPK